MGGSEKSENIETVHDIQKYEIKTGELYRYPVERVMRIDHGSIVSEPQLLQQCQHLVEEATPPDPEILEIVHEIHEAGIYTWVPGKEGEGPPRLHSRWDRLERALVRLDRMLGREEKRVFLHHGALLDLDQDPGKVLNVFIGGGMPNYPALQWPATYMAEKGGRCLELGGMRSKDVYQVPALYKADPRRSPNPLWYYGQDRERAFNADGYHHSRLLLDLMKCGQIQGGIRMIGLSTGAGVAIAMAERMATDPEFRDLLPELHELHLIGPCACMPVGTSEAMETLKLMYNFLLFSRNTLRDPWEKIVNWDDAGEGSHFLPLDVPVQARRCVATSLPEVAPLLPRTVQVNIHAGRDDVAIPYDKVRQTFLELGGKDLRCLIRMLILKGGHEVSIPSSSSLGHLLLNWPG